MLNTKILAELQTDKKWFIDLVSGHTHGFLYSPLSDDEWSIALVIEHLVIVEERIFSLVEKAAKDPDAKILRFSFTRYLKQLVVKFVLSNGIKVEVRNQAVAPLGNITIDDSIRNWNAVRLKFSLLNNLSDAHLRRYVFDHPRMGPLNIEQTIDFLRLHLRYHMIRVSRFF